ncbi:MAG: hypothetical protein WBB85_15825 [Albidovulum sp.]|uniref:hypothetical protein n=1 Tax=Albidovulum sp. TaxID=1872424 RepID=UPI003CC2C7FB
MFPKRLAVTMTAISLGITPAAPVMADAGDAIAGGIIGGLIGGAIVNGANQKKKRTVVRR